MEHVEYVYTVGMDEDELEDHLREEQHGVLSLADGGDAYAVPISFHYDGERLLLRVSHHDDAAEKREFLETTGTATFVLYDADTDRSWSVLVRGPVREWEDEVDETTLNEWFPPFRVFDESVDQVEFTLYELAMETVIGRKTA